MATSYEFEFCKDCPFYECELVEEYVQFRESHAQIKKLPYAKAEVFEALDYNNDDNNRVVHGIVTPATDAREMSDEGTKDGNKCIIQMGQKYLEYQLSWFGKKYCEDDDITFVNREKAKNELIAFLETYAESGEQIVNTGKESPFREEFTRLYDTAFGRRDRNKGRKYSITVMNACLEEESINYKIVSHSSYWVVEKCDWEIDDSE